MLLRVAPGLGESFTSAHGGLEQDFSACFADLTFSSTQSHTFMY